MGCLREDLLRRFSLSPNLTIIVKKVYMACVIYQEGDKMVLVESAIIPQDTDALYFPVMGEILEP